MKEVVWIVSLSGTGSLWPQELFPEFSGHPLLACLCNWCPESWVDLGWGRAGPHFGGRWLAGFRGAGWLRSQEFGRS